MTRLINPWCVVNFHTSDTRQLESLTHFGFQFIAANVEIFVQKLVGFNQTIGHGIAMGRRIVFQTNDTTATNGFHQCVKRFYIVGLETGIGKLSEMVKAFELALNSRHHRILFVGSIEQSMQKSSFDICEINGAS